MKPYIEKLKTHFAEHSPNYGDCDAHSVLEMLYTYYSQYNCLDTPQTKSDFEALYQQLTGKLVRELDNIIDTVITLCWHHEKSGFTGGALWDCFRHNEPHQALACSLTVRLISL